MGGLADTIRRGEPLPAPLAALLGAASLAQRAGIWWRLRGPRVRVNARVISFGNITAGGTGKTPAVIARAERELAAGHRVAVLTRGHGAERVREPLVREPGGAGPNDARMLGDEPALIARRLPGVWLVRARDRVAGARAAMERGCNVLLLDDGYQAVRLERDENILLIDAANPFGNGRILPRGILREPPEAMARATEIMLTRCDQAAGLDDLLQTVRRYCPATPLRMTRHAPQCLWHAASGIGHPAGYFSGEAVAALCAIGHPEAFFRTLESLGMRLDKRLAYPDHGVIPAGAVPSGIPVIVTEKDAVRMAAPPDNLYVLRVGLEDVSAE